MSILENDVEGDQTKPKRRKRSRKIELSTHQPSSTRPRNKNDLFFSKLNLITIQFWKSTPHLASSPIFSQVILSSQSLNDNTGYRDKNWKRETRLSSSPYRLALLLFSFLGLLVERWTSHLSKHWDQGGKKKNIYRSLQSGVSYISSET